MANGTIDDRHLVDDALRVEMRGTAFKQSQLIVGGPTRIAYDAAHQIVGPRNPEPPTAGWFGDSRQDFVAPVGRDPLIGIDEQHPLALRKLERRIPLARKVVEDALGYPGARRARQLARTVARRGIDEHEHFVREGDGAQAALDVLLLVPGDDGGRQPRTHETS